MKSQEGVNKVELLNKEEEEPLPITFVKIDWFINNYKAGEIGLLNNNLDIWTYYSSTGYQSFNLDFVNFDFLQARAHSAEVRESISSCR
ncbi:hypothetical protein LIER_19911 [Lithospermum erythrorhizon]|uniref:Uncharacterized protein n=1 Tax=Lithospermum erythrorhizon TaxID=34254 RepID=A0AAV3QMH4_LITER